MPPVVCGVGPKPDPYPLNDKPPQLTMKAVTLCGALILLSTSPASALQATWTTLGSGTAEDMSDDGLFAAGSDGGSAFLWSSTGGQINLGQDGAVAVSSDGTTVFGNMTDGGGNSNAGVWTQGTGWVAIPSLGGQSGSSITSAYAMSGDGTVAAGLGWINAGTAGAFRWTSAPSTTSALPQNGPNSSRANAVSEDGTHIGGWDEATNGSRRASFWDGNLAETFVAITATNPDGAGEVWGFSNNNTYVVGGTEGEGFVWDATNGLTKTGALPSTDLFRTGEARAVSNDGTVVVGWYRVAFPFDLRATIWTPAGGIQELKTVLEANGAVGVPNLTSAFAISGDGTRILASGGGVWGIADISGLGAVGTPYCFCPMGSPCGNDGGAESGCANSAGAGAILAGGGSASAGADDLTFQCTQLPANKPSLLFAGVTQTNGGAGNLFGDGLLCTGGGIQRLTLVFSSASGEAAYGPGIVAQGGWASGDTRNFQVWYRDTTGPCGTGFNTSNGVEVQLVP